MPPKCAKTGVVHACYRPTLTIHLHLRGNHASFRRSSRETQTESSPGVINSPINNWLEMQRFKHATL
jgi:hypothetical protein